MQAPSGCWHYVSRKTRHSKAVVAMREIILTQGKVSLVDDKDYKWLNEYKWYAHKDGYTYYAVRNRSIWTDGVGPGLISIHRVILKAKKGEICDHIDRNGLNNRRSNLQIVSARKNSLNSRLSKSNTSGFKGVYYVGLDINLNERWTAQIIINGIHKYIDVFATPEEAHEARQIYLEQYEESIAQ
ncbi:hypothetical protein LCGC14_0466170 [marine sediment metagenome]|uniref:HNH nuclease domain-containing protein n=1 Tax=marine sediment metagenome TaxID=412755 RepID=A0A0F9SWF4_9ZZZZ